MNNISDLIRKGGFVLPSSIPPQLALNVAPSNKGYKKLFRRTTESPNIQSALRGGTVIGVDTHNWTLTLLVDRYPISNVRMSSDFATPGTFDGGIPAIGSFCLFVQQEAKYRSQAERFAIKFFPQAWMASRDGLLLPAYNVFTRDVRPFKPYLNQGNRIVACDQGSMTVYDGSIRSLSKDLQEDQIEAAMHQSWRYTPHFTRAGGGVLYFSGGIIRGATDDPRNLSNGESILYVTSKDGKDWLEYAFDATVDAAALSEDQSVLFEHSDFLNPSPKYYNDLFDYKTLLDSLPLILEGKGTYSPPLSAFDNFGDVLSLALFSAVGDTASNISMSALSSVADREEKAISKWWFMPHGSIDPTTWSFDTVTKAGNRKAQFNKDEDGMSQEISNKGAMKITVGTDQGGEFSMHVDAESAVFLKIAGATITITKDGAIDVAAKSGQDVTVNAQDATVTAAGQVTVEGTTGVTLKSAAISAEVTSTGIELKTGDSLTWLPNILATDPLTGAPHGGPSAGIIKLKGG